MNDWRIPHGLANRVRDTTYKDAWEREIARTVELRGILTDLIAELKPLLRYDFVDHRMLVIPIERAEQRLREVSGDGLEPNA